jgi:hypothetical protein
MKLRRKLFYGFVIGLIACLMAGFWYLLFVPDPLYREPQPVRMILRHRAELDAFAERVHLGERVELGPGGSQFPAALIYQRSFGGTLYPRVYLDDGCLIVQYEWGPLDGNDYLIHSPRGYEGVPEKYKVREEPYFYHLQPVTAEWFYVKDEY